MAVTDDDDEEPGKIYDLLIHVDFILDVLVQCGRQPSVTSQTSDFAMPDDLTEIIANYTEDKDIAETIADCDDDGKSTQFGVAYQKCLRNMLMK